jgi:predicted nucleic acid-binding protein
MQWSFTTVMHRLLGWNVSNPPAAVPIGLLCSVRGVSSGHRRSRFLPQDFIAHSIQPCRARRPCRLHCELTGTRADEARSGMKFWDSSAVIPLLADEPTRKSMLQLLQQDPQVLIWWGTPIEIASALARLEREKSLTADEVSSALSKARQLADSWHEIVPSDAVRRTAERLLRAHPLRAADSLQLAAALIAADHDPSTLEIVCLDARLTSAARREGFAVLES